jgi:endo-1,4-beta-xylanase
MHPAPTPRASTRKRRLAGAATAAVVAAATATAGALVLAGPASAATTLRSLAEGQNRYFGTALTQSNLSNSTLTAVAGAQFDMVTPGNEMKWDTTEPSNGTFNFGPGDQIVSFATSHSDRIRGHNLVWHSQLPSWVSSLPLNQVQSAMETHITTEVTHYKGQIFAWDVVNEPFNDDGTYRTDVFEQAFGGGEQYIADAIKTAHAADPNAKLYINDYNIEGSGAKSNAMFTLAQQLLAAGVPLGGIGFESHFILGQIPSDMQSNMQRFANLGLDVAVTELDDRIQLPASSANLAQQATDYSNVVKDCLGVSRCVGVTQWGVGDADSWIPGFFSGFGAATMYDNNYQPKPAYNAVVTALGGTASSSPSASASASHSPSPSPSSSGGGTTGACKVTNSVSAWNTGLTNNITVTNTGTSAINGWKLTFTLASGQVVTNSWNATIAPTSGAVTATNMSYNAAIPAGGNATFGYQANHTGNSAAPTGFALNGTACSSS